MPTIFNFHDYRQYMNAQIEEAESNWGLISRMAEAAQCQRSQLSRILSGQMHLTLEQAYGLTDFWRLNEAEASYFLKLVEHARAGRADYRNRLERELAMIRRSQEDLSNRLRKPNLSSVEIETFYYSHWQWIAIHILVSIPEFQTPKQIAERLGLPMKTVGEALERLESHGLVQNVSGKWVYSGQTSHLPKSSPHIVTHHSNWRQRAVLDSQSPEAESVHYSVVQSISKKDFAKIKHLVLKAIEDYNAVAGPSKEEELICFCCDFFRV